LDSRFVPGRNRFFALAVRLRVQSVIRSYPLLVE
jgi:hypothetical protein